MKKTKTPKAEAPKTYPGEARITSETVIGKVEGENLHIEMLLAPGITAKGKAKWFSRNGDGPVRFLSALIVDANGNKTPVWVTPLHIIPATKKAEGESEE